MEFIVFVDTNIYENSNFSFYNNKFSKLKELIKRGTVKLLYNDVVYREVAQHIQEYTKEAVEGFNSAIGNRGFAPFRMSVLWALQLEHMKESELIKEQLQNWDCYLKECAAVKIPLNGIDVERVIENYFKKILPFENKKPTEFKDAIAIESIIKYAHSENVEKVYVVSNDKDFRKSFRNEKNIVTFDSVDYRIIYILFELVI